VAFDTVRPIKAILQGDGEVILAEFTDGDFVAIAQGGTGASTAQGARDSLQLIRYTEFDTLSDFDTSPLDKRLAKDSQTGLLYYSHNNVWQQIGSSITTGTSVDGVIVNEVGVEKFIFEGRVNFSYDPSTKAGTITIDVADIEARLDIIEADENTPDSIRYLIKQRFDELLDGVIPELDTLKEIADSLGDTLNFRTDFETFRNTIVLGSGLQPINGNYSPDTNSNYIGSATSLFDADIILDTEITRVETDLTSEIARVETDLTTQTSRIDTIDGDDQTTGSFRKAIKDRFDILLDGVSSDRDTLKEIADALGDFVSTDFTNHVNDFNSHVADFNALENEFDALVGGALSGLNTNITTMESDINTLQSQMAIVDGDDQTTGSFRKAIKDRFDILLDNVSLDFDTLKEIQDALAGNTNIGSQLADVFEILNDLEVAQYDLDITLLENRNTILTNQSAINTINTNLQNFSYTGHNISDIPTSGTTFLVYDTNTNKYTFSTVQSVGGADDFNNFIPFVNHTGVRDDIPLVSLFLGNTLQESYLNFTMSDGTIDNINLEIN